MRQPKQELAIIQNFNLLPRSSLEQLGKHLRLRMSLPELLFCARHYTNSNNEISVSALRFLDALACPPYPLLSKIAIGEFLSEQACIANAFTGAVTAIKAQGKDPKKPYTLQDFATLASHGAPSSARIVQRALYGDALVLLNTPECLPTNVTQYARCVCDCTKQSPMHAVLRLCDGAVLELARLPEQMQDPLALTECRDAWLLALPQDALPALLEQTQALGLHAVIMGVVTDHGTLEIRNSKHVLLSQDMAFLRSICFIRSYRVQADQVELYQSIQMQAAHAFAQAVAAGCAPAEVTLGAQLHQSAQSPVSQSAADLLCVLLGLYRFSDATQVPVQIEAKFDALRTQQTITAAMPDNATLQEQSRIYLLAPQSDADGMPDLRKLRALTEYLHEARAQGKLKSIRAVCNATPEQVLATENCGIIYNPHVAQTIAQKFSCAFLAETDFELAGELVAVSTLPKPQNSEEIYDNIQ